MPVQVNHSFLKIISKYPEAVLIYSMLEGYLDERSQELSQFVLPFKETGNIRYLHSSGHATSTDAQLICNAVMPKRNHSHPYSEWRSFQRIRIKMPDTVFEKRGNSLFIKPHAISLKCGEYVCLNW